jgi:hypothetical protein
MLWMLLHCHALSHIAGLCTGKMTPNFHPVFTFFKKNRVSKSCPATDMFVLTQGETVMDKDQ